MRNTFSRFYTVAFSLLYLFTIDATHAMEFSIIRLHIPIVLGKGEIGFGDSEKLQAALAQVPRDQFGLKIIALDSPGGLVEAAFQMARVMDATGVSTVVPPGASCASACASILYIAGRTHAVVGAGRIGFHTCYRSAARVGDEICNERIAQFALEHGTAFNAVHIFMEVTAPDGMLWLNSFEADCHGLTAWPTGQYPRIWNGCVIGAINHTGPRQRDNSDINNDREPIFGGAVCFSLEDIRDVISREITLSPEAFKAFWEMRKAIGKCYFQTAASQEKFRIEDTNIDEMVDNRHQPSSRAIIVKGSSGRRTAYSFLSITY